MTKNKYPYIGEYKYTNGEIVRVNFTGRCTGQVIYSTSYNHKVGKTHDDWSESIFTKIEEKVMKKLKSGDIIVGSQMKDGSSAVSVSANPHVHTTVKEADTEAERLAKEFPEKRFLVLEVKVAIETSTIICCS
jgi:hypothetical protein